MTRGERWLYTDAVKHDGGREEEPPTQGPFDTPSAACIDWAKHSELSLPQMISQGESPALHLSRADEHEASLSHALKAPGYLDMLAAAAMDRFGPSVLLLEDPQGDTNLRDLLEAELGPFLDQLQERHKLHIRLLVPSKDHSQLLTVAEVAGMLFGKAPLQLERQEAPQGKMSGNSAQQNQSRMMPHSDGDQDNRLKGADNVTDLSTHG